MRFLLLSGAALLASCRVVGIDAGGGVPAVEAIRDSQVAADIRALASDAMRGREAGTIDELRASMWIAERAREAGLEPAGDDGTYFQFFNLRRARIADGAVIEIGGRRFELWQDAVVTAPVDARLSAPLTWIGAARGDALRGMNLAGKAVAAEILPLADGRVISGELTSRRYARLALTERTRELQATGAAAIVLVSDTITDAEFSQVGSGMRRGSYMLDTGAVAPRTDTAARRPAGADARAVPAPVIWIRRGAIDRTANGARLRLELAREQSRYPSVNVIARVRGSESTRRDEYVLFSAHQDHDGVRHDVNGDSTWNGADDNASGSVALLAIGRAFARKAAPRSALFVWHGAEEKGLLGSRWHAMHPVVPRANIVAVLNADMIGRNHPDTAALLGSQPPHRSSAALVEMALAANERVSKFVVDSSWDRPDHPEGFYFRSDHAPYARMGIPALFFTTKLHPDYHTVRDAAGGIDVGKLTRMARWMYATGWRVASASNRVTVDEGFALER